MASRLCFSPSQHSALALRGTSNGMRFNLQQRNLKLVTSERSSRASEAGITMFADNFVRIAMAAKDNQAVISGVFESVGFGAWYACNVYHTKLENSLFAAHLDIKWIQEGNMGQKAALSAVQHWQTVFEGYRSTGDAIKSFAVVWASLSGLFLMLLICPTPP